MLWLHLSILFFLILLNGFFAMAEIALVSARPARLQPLAGAGNAGARAAIELKADPSRLLATVQEQRGWTNMTSVARPFMRGIVVVAGQWAGGAGSGFGVLLYFQSIPVPKLTTTSQSRVIAIWIR